MVGKAINYSVKQNSTIIKFLPMKIIIVILVCCLIHLPFKNHGEAKFVQISNGYL